LKGKWEERVEEAKALESNIVRYANNPLKTHDEWSQAADKWQFLRACFEIRDVLENPDHQSHLICELDQSTSCLQHMALVLDDVEMMVKVNLGPEYSDIYQIIGDDLELEGEVSPQHRRKIVKTALVPFGYGSGIKKIAQAYDESDLPYLVQLSPSQRFQLARDVVEKIKQHLPTAKTYQEEMAKLASRLIDEGKDHFHWKTSSGFEVHHFKQQQKEERERILLRTKHSEGEENKYARLVAYEPQGTADREALIRGLAPNFIHSIDASVIHSLLSAHGEVDALVTVHDALGAHASSMHKLTELFYLHLLIIYKGFNPKMYFDGSMLGIEIPILQMERGISEEATNLLIQSQHALT
jgi:DNA-directed RNA polymerase